MNNLPGNSEIPQTRPPWRTVILFLSSQELLDQNCHLVYKILHFTSGLQNSSLLSWNQPTGSHALQHSRSLTQVTSWATGRRGRGFNINLMLFLRSNLKEYLNSLKILFLFFFQWENNRGFIINKTFFYQAASEQDGFIGLLFFFF